MNVSIADGLVTQLVQGRFLLKTTRTFTVPLQSSETITFTIHLRDEGDGDALSFGICRGSHREARHVGWETGSIGYHSDDGKLFEDGGSVEYGNQWDVDDEVSIVVKGQVLWFVHNKMKLSSVPIPSGTYHIALCCDSENSEFELEVATNPFLPLGGTPTTAPPPQPTFRLLPDASQSVVQFSTNDAKTRAGQTRDGFLILKTTQTFTVPSPRPTSFKLLVQKLGPEGAISLGICDNLCPDFNQHVGWWKNAIGFHSDDGKLFTGSGTGMVGYGVPWKAGDRLRVDVEGEILHFTHNEKELQGIRVRPGTFHFAVGFASRDSVLEFPCPPPFRSIAPRPFLKVALFLCYDCQHVDMPSCGRHQMHLATPSPHGLKCPEPNCGAQSRRAQCAYCGESDLQMVMVKFLEESVRAVKQSFLQQRMDPVPCILSVCTECQAAEFYKPVEAAFSVIVGATQYAMQPFTHVGACNGKLKPIVCYMPKEEIQTLAANFARTLQGARASIGMPSQAGPPKPNYRSADEDLSILLERLGIRPPSPKRPPPRPTNPSRIKVAKAADQIHQETKTNAIVVASFMTSWCGPCKAFSPKYDDIASTHNNVIFFAVFMENESPSFNCFEITSLPTIIVFHQGTQHDRVMGGNVPLIKGILAELSDSSEPEVVALDRGQTAWLEEPDNATKTKVTNTFHTTTGAMYEGLIFDVIDIKSVRNPTLQVKFDKHRTKLGCDVTAAFHGTKSNNVTSICQRGFLMERKGATDSGFFGSGLYFSPYSDYTFAYSHMGRTRPIRAGEEGTVILCDILLGKVFKTELDLGGGLMSGYDCHVSPRGCEWILFHSDQVVPRFVIKFRAVAGLRRDGTLAENENGENWEKEDSEDGWETD
ncbi:Elongation factor 1-beta [Podochytrium sp. JEL0797]|nr:Elongation factor 1-beta [Podochytrium sp. JEL0797]